MKPTNIRLYSTATCPFCKMEKTWLDSQNIDHELVMVDQNQAEAEAMIRKTGQMGVPVTEFQYKDQPSKFVIGFDQAALKQLLDGAGA